MVVGVAMFLKVVLYLVCSWLLVSGKLLYYFQEMRVLHGLEQVGPDDQMARFSSVDDRFKAFLQDVGTEGLHTEQAPPMEGAPREGQVPAPEQTGRIM
jgi:hypothetical protein